MRPKHSLGQHFLIDKSVLASEAALAEITGKRILEIGPGEGALTGYILEKKPSYFLAIEKDKDLIPALREKFTPHSKSKLAKEITVEFLEGDFLEYFPKKGEKFDVIFGNIPYYISSPILFRLKDFEFERAILCLQKEFAERLVAKAGGKEYSRLSVMSSIYFETALKQIVYRGSFYPPPEVDSAIVVLKKTGGQIDPFAEQLITALFSHKRKSVRNAFTDSAKQFGMKKPDARSLIETVKNSGKRVVTLSADELLAIAAEVKKLMPKQ